jgi:hypothetical protein
MRRRLVQVWRRWRSTTRNRKRSHAAILRLQQLLHCLSPIRSDLFSTSIRNALFLHFTRNSKSAADEKLNARCDNGCMEREMDRRGETKANASRAMGRRSSCRSSNERVRGGRKAAAMDGAGKRREGNGHPTAAANVDRAERGGEEQRRQGGRTATGWLCCGGEEGRASGRRCSRLMEDARSGGAAMNERGESGD